MGMGHCNRGVTEGSTVKIVVPALEKVEDTRPPCPECGERHIQSHGRYWACQGCGREWQKTYRGKPKTDFSDRPPCPECAARKTIKNGNKWMCKVCGKQWLKHG